MSQHFASHQMRALTSAEIDQVAGGEGALGPIFVDGGGGSTWVQPFFVNPFGDNLGTVGGPLAPIPADARPLTKQDMVTATASVIV
jgi:hypothetical protein